MENLKNRFIRLSYCFFKNPKFALSIWWEDLVFGAEVIKILLDPDHLGHVESKSRKFGVFDFFPLAQI